MIAYFKNATKLFFKISVNRYDIGLSSELLFIVIGQEAAKM